MIYVILILLTITLHWLALNRYNYVKNKTSTGYLADALLALVLIGVVVITDTAWALWFIFK